MVGPRFTSISDIQTHCPSEYKISDGAPRKQRSEEILRDVGLLHFKLDAMTMTAYGKTQHVASTVMLCVQLHLGQYPCRNADEDTKGP